MRELLPLEFAIAAGARIHPVAAGLERRSTAVMQVRDTLEGER